MSKWKEYQLFELADVIMGQSPPSSAYNEENIGLPFLQGCSEFGDDYPNARIYCTDPKKLAPANSILISVRAPVGLTNKSDKEYVIGRGLAAIVPTRGVFKFLYYQLNQNKYKLDRVSQGSTFLAINSNDLNYLLIDAPISKNTQRKIARVLSTADAVIEKTQAAIAKYKAIKQGMLHDLFTRGIDPVTGKLRPTYKDAPKLYKESKLGWIPKEWEVKTLDELLNKEKPVTYGIVQPGEYVNNGVYMIRSQDYTNGWNGIETIMQVHPSIDRPYERSRVSKNDILITVVGANVGRMAIVPEILHESNISRSVARISIDENICQSKYCYYYLNSQIKDILFANQVGGAQPVINLKSLEKFKIFKPKEILEQKEIANRSDAIDKKIQTEQTYLHKLQQMKAGLMADLLSGKKKVNVDEEPVN